MSYTEHHLPHWAPDGKFVFVTWSLYGHHPKLPDIEGLPAGKRFALYDRELHAARYGACWLTDTRIAEAVQDCLVRHDPVLHHLRAFVIMPNHVHVLLKPAVPLKEVMQRIKGSTAREANRILGLTGRPFWNPESFDHWVRTEKEFNDIIRYIEYNPVSAGFVLRPEDWKHSSALAG